MTESCEGVGNKVRGGQEPVKEQSALVVMVGRRFCVRWSANVVCGARFAYTEETRMAPEKGRSSRSDRLKRYKGLGCLRVGLSERGVSTGVSMWGEGSR